MQGASLLPPKRCADGSRQLLQPTRRAGPQCRHTRHCGLRRAAGAGLGGLQAVISDDVKKGPEESSVNARQQQVNMCCSACTRQRDAAWKPGRLQQLPMWLDWPQHAVQPLLGPETTGLSHQSLQKQSFLKTKELPAPYCVLVTLWQAWQGRRVVP